MASVLITGSRGFIASELALRLIEEGHELEGFDVYDGRDIRNLGQVKDAVKGKDAVFHLAAIADLNRSRVRPLETMDVNVKGTWNVATACQESGATLYFASTCCVYGNQSVHPVSETRLPNPAEIYACSKLAAESVIKAFHFTYGLQYNLMRFATIYGPGTRPALATHIFMGQALRGENITVHGDGKQTRTLTYISDLVDGIIALYNSGKVNDVWNLSAEEEISARQMAEDIKRIACSQSFIVHTPQRVGQTFKESISADKMRQEVGWEAKTDWRKGLAEMYDWYVSTNQVEHRYEMPTEAKVCGPVSG